MGRWNFSTTTKVFFAFGAGAGLVVGLLVARGGGNSEGSETLSSVVTTAAETVTTTTTRPEPLSLPTSWESGGIRLTLVEVVPVGTNLAPVGLSGVDADEGYTFVGVRGDFENLTNDEKSYNEIRDAPSVALRLVTDRGNRYERSMGGYAVMVLLSDHLRPEETVEDWVTFEIRQDEKPVRLEGDVYDEDSGGWQLRYIWLLAAP